MCGSLKHEGTLQKIGQDIFFIDKNTEKKGIWAGHARSETLKEKWLDRGCIPITIKADSFTEKDKAKKDHFFKVPEGWAIEGVLVTRPIDLGSYIHGPGEVLIVTRPAKGKEAKVHDRFPKFVRREK